MQVAIILEYVSVMYLITLIILI